MAINNGTNTLRFRKPPVLEQGGKSEALRGCVKSNK